MGSELRWSTSCQRHQAEREKSQQEFCLLIPLVDVGKKFFTWQTLASFGGSVAAIKIIWEVLKAMQFFGKDFQSFHAPFWASIILISAIALFTEPDSGVEQTNWQQKGQKVVQTIFNALFVFAAVIGIGAAIAQ